MSNGLRKWSTNFSIAAVVLLPIWMLQLSFQKRAPTSSRSDPPVRPITSRAVDRVHTPETLRKSSASNNLSNSTAISYTLFNKVPHRVAKGKKSLLLGGKGTIYQGGHPPVGRGEKNVAFADFSTSPGGKGHVAQGRRTFVAGKGTRASLQGAFVWAGKSENIFKSIKNIHFTARADSNSGVAWPPGSVSFSSLRSIHQRHDACVTF